MLCVLSAIIIQISHTNHELSPSFLFSLSLPNHSFIFSFNLNHEMIIYIKENCFEFWIHDKIWLNDPSFWMQSYYYISIIMSRFIIISEYFWFSNHFYLWKTPTHEEKGFRYSTSDVNERTDNKILYSKWIEWEKNCAVHSRWHLTAEYEMTQPFNRRMSAYSGAVGPLTHTRALSLAFDCHRVKAKYGTKDMKY